MSENIDLNLILTANVASAEKAIETLKGRIAEFNAMSANSEIFPQKSISRVKQLESEMFNTISAIKGANIETVKLTSAADHMTQRFTQGQMGISELFGNIRKNSKGLSSDLDTIAQSQAKIASGFAIQSGVKQDMAYYITSAGAMADQTVQAETKVRLLNSAWSQMSTNITNWGKNVQWAGRQLTVGLTVPIAAAAAGLADYANKVNKNLTMLQRVYGIGGNYGGQFQAGLPSKTQLEQVKQEVLGVAQAMSKMYGTSAETTTSVAAQLAATGYTNQQLLSLTESTVKAMTLGDVQQTDALKAVVALQNVYKLSTTDVGNAMNFLSSAQASTSATMAELIQAMPKVGPLAVTLGANYKDVVAMLVAMRQGGIGAVEGANALKTSLQRLVSPTKQATIEMASFGINIKQIVQSNAGNLVGMIESLQRAMSGLDPIAKSQALTALFGKMQAVRMEALLNNFNTMGSQSAKIMQMAQLSNGQIADIAKHETQQIQQSLSGQFKIAVESLKTELLPIGETFLHDATNIVKFINKVIDALKILKPYAGIFKAIILGLSIAGPILMFSGLMGNLAGFVLKLYNNFRMLRQGIQDGFATNSVSGFFSVVTKSFNNYFQEQDKAVLAAEKLSDVTKTSTAEQAMAWSQVTDAVNRYANAITEVMAAQTQVSGLISSSPAGATGAAAAGGNVEGRRTSGQTKSEYRLILSKYVDTVANQAQGNLGDVSFINYDEAQHEQNIKDMVQKLQSSKSFKNYSEDELRKIIEPLFISAQRNRSGTSELSRFVAGQRFSADRIAQLNDENNPEFKQYRDIIKNENLPAEKRARASKSLTELIFKGREEAVNAIALGVESELERIRQAPPEMQSQLKREFEGKLLRETAQYVGKLKGIVGVESLKQFTNQSGSLLSQATSITKTGMENAFSSVKKFLPMFTQKAGAYHHYAARVNINQPESPIVEMGAAENTASNVETQKSTAATEKDTQATEESTAATEKDTQATEESTAATEKDTQATEESTAATQQLADTTNAATQATENVTKSLSEFETRVVEDTEKLNSLNEEIISLNTKISQYQEEISKASNSVGNVSIAQNALAQAEERLTQVTQEQMAAEEQLNISSKELMEAQMQAAMQTKEGGMMSMMGGMAGKAAMGIGMLAPMIAQPLSNKLGGSSTTAGGAVSGAGTGAMYGSMVGMAFGPEGAAVGALGGALVGAIVGAFKGHSAEIQQKIAAETQGVVGAFNLTSTSIDAFHVKVNSLANYTLPIITQGMSVQESAVQKLADTYKTATDTTTQAMLKLVAAGGQVSKNLLQGQFFTTLAQTGNLQSAQQNALGIISAAGGGVLQQRTQALYIQKQADVYKKGGINAMVAGLMQSAGLNTPVGITGTSTAVRSLSPQLQHELTTTSGHGGGYVTTIAADAAYNPTVAKQITTNYQANPVAMQAATSIENTLLTALNPVQFEKELGPMKQLFGNLGNATAATKQQFVVFQNTISQFAPQLSPLVDQMHAAGDSTTNMAKAINLMTNGFISSANDLMAAAANLNGIMAGYEASAAQDQAVSKSLGGQTGVAGIVSSNYAAQQQAAQSQNLGSPAVPASGGGGGGGSGTSANAVMSRGIKNLTDHERSIQKEIDARDANIQVLQAQTQQAQANYDAQQKIIQAGGSGDAVAKAQAQTDATLISRSQAQIVAATKMDALDKKKISTIQNQITDLQAAGGDPKAVAQLSKLYTDQMRTIQKEIDARDEMVKIVQEQVQSTETLMGLQNQAIQARGSGDILGVALAQNSYNQERNMAAIQLSADKADYAGKEQITALQNKITDLQSANQAATAAGGAGGGGGGGGTKAVKAVPPSVLAAQQQKQAQAENIASQLDLMAKGYVADSGFKNALGRGSTQQVTSKLTTVGQATQVILQDSSMMKMVKHLSQLTGMSTGKLVNDFAKEILTSPMNTVLPKGSVAALKQLHATTLQMYKDGQLTAKQTQAINNMSLQAQKTLQQNASTAAATALVKQVEGNAGIKNLQISSHGDATSQANFIHLVQTAITDGNQKELSRWGMSAGQVQSAMKTNLDKLVTQTLPNTNPLGSAANPLNALIKNSSSDPVHTTSSNHSTGGPIVGAGTSTSDSIPTMLSNGEYVIRASSVNKFGKKFLDAVNAGTYVPPTITGLKDIYPSISGGASNAAVYNINVNVEGNSNGGVDADKIAKVVYNVLERRERVNGTRRSIG
jgi:Phage-related minor tail protein